MYPDVIVEVLWFGGIIIIFCCCCCCRTVSFLLRLLWLIQPLCVCRKLLLLCFQLESSLRNYINSAWLDNEEMCVGVGGRIQVWIENNSFVVCGASLAGTGLGHRSLQAGGTRKHKQPTLPTFSSKVSLNLVTSTYSTNVCLWTGGGSWREPLATYLLRLLLTTTATWPFKTNQQICHSWWMSVCWGVQVLSQAVNAACFSPNTWGDWRNNGLFHVSRNFLCLSPFSWFLCHSLSPL